MLVAMLRVLGSGAECKRESRKRRRGCVFIGKPEVVWLRCGPTPETLLHSFNVRHDLSVKSVSIALCCILFSFLQIHSVSTRVKMCIKTGR